MVRVDLAARKGVEAAEVGSTGEHACVGEHSSIAAHHFSANDAPARPVPVSFKVVVTVDVVVINVDLVVRAVRDIRGR